MAKNRRSLRDRRKQQHAERKRARRLRWAAVAGMVVLLAGALLIKLKKILSTFIVLQPQILENADRNGRPIWTGIISS